MLIEELSSGPQAATFLSCILNNLQDESLYWNSSFAYGKFAKFKFCLYLDFYKSSNDSLYHRNAEIKIRYRN